MKMNLVDKVFVVNLDERPDRLMAMDYQLNKQGIEYERFAATKNDNGIAGLLITMKRLFTESLEKGYKNIIVFEDDAEFMIPNVVAFFNHVVTQLPADFHCFHFGINLLSTPERISQNILRIDEAFSSHAIMYSSEGIRLILPLLDLHPITPYDIILRREVQIYKRCYATFPMICTQSDGFSNIEKKITYWKNTMATTYSMHTKNIQEFPPQFGETIKCFNGHMIDGMPVTVIPSKFEIQNKHLIGKVCDCKKFSYDEEECNCTRTPKEWLIKWRENVN